MKKMIILPLLLMVTLSGCISTLNGFLISDKPLTESEVAGGLKEALKKGVEVAVSALSNKDGYYGDPLLRLALPPEADKIVENIARIPGGRKLLDDLIVRINRSAEEAASEALPIFISAITEMTIMEAFEILRGEDDAATAYFRSKSYAPLIALYEPRLDYALGQDLAGGISAEETWDTLSELYNALAGSLAGRLAGMAEVHIDLSEYLTEKALDGIFVKVAEEEKAIRKDPLKRVTALLKRVFGSLD